ncbi:hypothetical protein K9N68_37240 (plasmid) [Kovacikia minuta CCNUW1]|uniref:hypothetical protein n=1 Tax=Kovacikia minuta TaxID=2931930 RepID=UPI001CCCC3CE|nr:hypothetical protein [Kovacikia minuta]UBF29858.1 hypothetical protein K9N68_37240 [Kovacikia minuta CCNUW1]
MAYEVKKQATWQGLDYINPLKYGGLALDEIQRRLPGYVSSGDRLQQSLNRGDYDAAAAAYQEFQPRNQEELAQADQARRVLSGRDQQLKNQAEQKTFGQFKQFGDYDLGRQQNLLNRQIAGQTAIARIGADAGIKQTEIGANAGVRQAEIGAGASNYSALMGYQGAMGTARIGADASKFASQMGYRGAVDTAKIGADVARYQANTNLTGIRDTNLTQKQIADMTSGRQLKLGIQQDSTQRLASFLQGNASEREGLRNLAVNVLQRSSFR